MINVLQYKAVLVQSRVLGGVSRLADGGVGGGGGGSEGQTDKTHARASMKWIHHSPLVYAAAAARRSRRPFL